MSNIHRWTEFEDWVEFYSSRQLAHIGDGRFQALVNFGGPGTAVAYQFYARTRKGAENVITKVDVDGVEFQPVNEVVPVKDTPADYSWVHLGYAKSNRIYRDVTFTAPDGLAGLDRICVLEITQRLESGEVERRIAHEDVPEPLSGVPLGGVGAGKIEFCRDGLFRNITINGNIDTPIWRTEGSFFAVRAECEGKSLGRIVGSDSLHGLTPMESVKYDGLYPGATLSTEDRYFPLSIDISATGIVIPHNVKDSSLPLALFRVTLTASEDEPVKASVAFSMENFLGRGGQVASLADRSAFDQGYYELWDERAGNSEQSWKDSGAQGLLFDSGVKEEKRSEGQYVLATDASVTSYLTGWRFGQSGDVWNKFVDTGMLPGSVVGSSTGEQTAGAIAVDVDLAAGESKDVLFAFAWYVPHFWQAAGQDYGHYYTNDFSSAAEVVLYGLKNFDRLERESADVPELIMNSDLPEWFARTLCNDAYTFSTVTWLTRDGRFAVNEGPTHMFGCMGTIDQKLYGSHYYTLFFPDLDRTELLDFVRSQGEDGSIQHDMGYGHLEQKGKGHHWPDLSSSLAILSLKHYQMTGDQEYIDEAYPVIVRALLEYQLGLDSDGDSIANISGVGNTFDSEKYEGTSSYIASLWLAALKSLEDLARRRGDTEVEKRCREVFEKARVNAIDELFNGRFFANYYDTTKKQLCPNSHISQVAGELFGRLCNLGNLYGDEYVRQATASMMELNYSPRFKIPTNEATPDGKMPYRSLWGWLPHLRVCLGAIPMYFGLVDEGLHALEQMDDAITEINNDNRWDLRLFYEPDTGKEHWGRFYMTAPATWYAYQALLGFTWDKPEGTLGLIPNLPDSMLPFQGPLFLPGFWAWMTADEDRENINLRILRKFDTGLSIRKLRLSPNPGVPLVTVDGKEVPVETLAPKSLGLETLYACDIDLDNADEINIERRFRG